MIVDYDKVLIVVITDKNELKKYFTLFKVLLKDKITMSRLLKDMGILETEDFNIRFTLKSGQLRGWKTHYILNLIQDKEFHNELAIPMTVINGMLDKDKWGLI